MSDDDPTQWFRPKPARGEGPVDVPSSEPAPTEPFSPPPADPQATQALDRDGLDALFGEQRDYSSESDWLPPESDPAPDLPTAVYGAQHPGADPLGWLGDGSSVPKVDSAATTVAFGAAANAGLSGHPDDGITGRVDSPPREPIDGGEPPGSKRTVVILAIVGALLLVGIAIALIAFFTSGTSAPAARRSQEPTTSSEPSTSATPSTSPSPSPSTTPSTTPTAPPPVPAATIGSFTASPSTPACADTAGTANVSFSWSTSDATRVALAIDGGGTVNDQLSASGTISSVPFDCSKPSQGYTLTASNSKGIQTSKTLTLTRPAIDPPPAPTPTPTPGEGGDNN